jgi:hypothetical protein
MTAHRRSRPPLTVQLIELQFVIVLQERGGYRLAELHLHRDQRVDFVIAAVVDDTADTWHRHEWLANLLMTWYRKRAWK